MIKPRVLLIGGSHAEPSHTSALLRAAERCLALRDRLPLYLAARRYAARARRLVRKDHVAHPAR